MRMPSGNLVLTCLELSRNVSDAFFWCAVTSIEETEESLEDSRVCVFFLVCQMFLLFFPRHWHSRECHWGFPP